DHSLASELRPRTVPVERAAAGHYPAGIEVESRCALDPMTGTKRYGVGSKWRAGSKATIRRPERSLLRARTQTMPRRSTRWPAPRSYPWHCANSVPQAPGEFVLWPYQLDTNRRRGAAADVELSVNTAAQSLP